MDSAAYGGVSGGVVPPRRNYNQLACSSCSGVRWGWGGRGLIGMDVGVVRICSRNSAAGGSRNSPGRTKGAPYTSSAEEMLLSSLGAALRPNNPHGRWSGQAAPASLLFRASFNCLWALSIRLLLCRGVVRRCGGVLHAQLAAEGVPDGGGELAPLSEVMRVGTPSLDTQLPIKAFAQEAADMSWSGMASNHLVDLSTAVKM